MITARAETDITAPQLTGLSITPVAVDVSRGPATVAVRITATDDLSGLMETGVNIDVRAENGGNPFGSSVPRTSGTVLNGVFEIVLTVPQFSPSGTYPITIALTDKVFNSVSLSAIQLAARGLPSNVTVTSVPDTTPPQLTGLSITPVAVDVSRGPATVAVRITATDDLSGLMETGVNIDVRAENGGNPFGSSVPRTSGTVLNGVFEIALTVPQFSPSGTYPITIALTDKVFNSVSLSATQLAARGLPSNVTVTSVPDAMPPQLTGLSITPVAVDVSRGPATVAVRITANDDLSGLMDGGVNIDVRDENGGNPFGSSVPRTSGTMLNGVFEIVLTVPQFSPPGTYPITITLTDRVFNSVSVSSAQLAVRGLPPYIAVSSASTSAISGLLFVPISPCRAVDTRLPQSQFGGPGIDREGLRTFPLAGACGLPVHAKAYSMNVTVVPEEALGYLTLWPAGGPRPLVSTLNSFDGRVKANAATVMAGVNGAVNLFATDRTHVILDVNGYYTTPETVPGLAFYPMTPCRIVDTRGPVGTFGGPRLEDREARGFPLSDSSACIVPKAARAYALNITAVPLSGRLLGYLTAWADGRSQPFVSTLNSPTGTVVANAAIVPAGDDGGIRMFVTDSAHLILDITGYFAPVGGLNALSFWPTTPCRLSDTRQPSSIFGGPTLVPDEQRSYVPFLSSCRLPSHAEAFLLNVTSVPLEPLGYLTVWPAGYPRPLVSTLNSFDASVTSNAAIAPAGTNGAFNVFATNRTEVILDLFGYFAH